MPSESNCSYPNISLTISNYGREDPWVPTEECKFKCCHNCRPNGAERSWISLNGVANGDLPLTAVTGFGFQFFGRRFVTLVENMRNIGLRKSPRPKSVSVSNFFICYLQARCNGQLA